MMTATFNLRRPTTELVIEACSKFDQNNSVIEEALFLLFKQYEGNASLPRVLLKIVSLNRLYSTQILAVVDVAKHIQGNADEIDHALLIGSPDVVETIGLVTIAASGKSRYNYSFATKYSSWHNPEAYPIWDSRVDKYLWHLQKQDNFAEFFKTNAELWEYPKFLAVMIAFRDFYSLQAFTFKQIDKFLWSEIQTVDEKAAEEQRLVDKLEII